MPHTSNVIHQLLAALREPEAIDHGLAASISRQLHDHLEDGKDSLGATGGPSVLDS